jgi:hypothetical protein
MQLTMQFEDIAVPENMKPYSEGEGLHCWLSVRLGTYLNFAVGL